MTNITKTANLYYNLPDDIKIDIEKRVTRLKFNEVVKEINNVGKSIVEERWKKAFMKYLLVNKYCCYDGFHEDEMHSCVRQIIGRSKKFYRLSVADKSHEFFDVFRFIDKDIVNRFKLGFKMKTGCAFEDYALKGNTNDDYDNDDAWFSFEEMCEGLCLRDLTMDYLMLSPNKEWG
jgi:hypothetical protein